MGGAAWLRWGDHRGDWSGVCSAPNSRPSVDEHTRDVHYTTEKLEEKESMRLSTGDFLSETVGVLTYRLSPLIQREASASYGRTSKLRSCKGQLSNQVKIIIETYRKHRIAEFCPLLYSASPGGFTAGAS